MAVSVNNTLWQQRTDQTKEHVYIALSRCNELVCSVWLWYFLIILTYFLWLYLSTIRYGNIGLTKLNNVCTELYGLAVNNALWQHRTNQTKECVYRALWLYLSNMLYGNIGLTKLRSVCTELYGCICQQCFMTTLDWPYWGVCVQSFMAVSVNNALWQHWTDQTEECVYRALRLYLSTMLYDNIGLTKLRNVYTELYGCICQQCFMTTLDWPNWGVCVQSFMAVSVNNALWQHRTDQTEEWVYRALWLYLSTTLYGNIGLTKLRNMCTELYGCICQQCFMTT